MKCTSISFKPLLRKRNVIHHAPFEIVVGEESHLYFCYICFGLFRVNSSIGKKKKECAGKRRGTRGIDSATRRYGRCEVVAYYSVDHQVEVEHKEEEESKEGSEQESEDEFDDHGDKLRVCIQ
ncbi:zinc finger MYND domain-containing protein 15 isoform X1 [Cucumis melo var. makuwa]|uniref:Zinc finger MYND domain-containing protein 15 isoform X1 n=1 Tax=Cucumis melo var. makuwa TaxID=1194695 RepID=A0A5D3DGM9_CUCMM|nr:zinc finger MYND domain-containing protein 15 isoform X1 [Cucumis melo var. makuwa]